MQDLPNSSHGKSKETDFTLKESLNPRGLSESKSLRQLAWCTRLENTINIMDLETKQKYFTFQGVQTNKLNTSRDSWTHLKEVPNTRFLVSLDHCWGTSANLKIYDISKENQAMEVFAFGGVLGITGFGDLAYNSRRGLLAGICLSGKIAYHLFKIYSGPSEKISAKLYRKSKWHQQNSSQSNCITSLDFDQNGEMMATIDRYGVCVISDVNDNKYSSHRSLEMLDHYIDDIARCRWSTNIGEPFLFIKYDWKSLNILDLEKKTLTLRRPVQLEKTSYVTNSIDVCPHSGNLLAAGGTGKNIKIYDRRASKIALVFSEVHSHRVNCVRWDPSKNILASASHDKTVKLVDFGTGKVTHTEATTEKNCLMSVCFI